MLDSMNFQFAEDGLIGAIMKVVGVGGAGGNAVDRMVASKLQGVDFLAFNTDIQALDRSSASLKLQLGRAMTRGRGAGANPEIGYKAAEQDEETISEALKDTDLVFITAGMGGGTGTGAAPKVAQLARDQKALTVAIVTLPFNFEGKRRLAVAEAGIVELRKHVDTLVVIPNQSLLSIVDAKTSLKEAFILADMVLTQATEGISDLIAKTGVVNLDFADVRTVMSNGGDALMGIGNANGEDRGVEAATKALRCPLLQNFTIHGAQNVLVNVTGSSEITLFEVDEALSVIYDSAGEEANVIFGAVIDEDLGDELRVTVIATGFDNGSHYSLNSSQKAQEEVAARQKSGTMSNAASVRNRRLENALESHSNQSFKSNVRRRTVSNQTERAVDTVSSGRRIHLGEIDINGDPPSDLSLPAYLRRNGGNGN